MTDPDRPATRRELREELGVTRRELGEDLAVTRRELREGLGVTRRELGEDLAVTRRELREDLQAFVTRDELREKLQVLATKEDLRQLRDELRTHFDVVAESFKSEFGTLHDWVEANTNSLATRVEKLENGHGTRLLSLEGRVTNLENRRK